MPVITPNKLSFEVLPTSNCNTLAIADTSIYNGVPEGATLQVELPDSSVIKEFPYTTGGVTVLNSNSLGYTNVSDLEDLQALPDGVYTIKISICPYDIFWYEKDYYRTCQLECKYYKAVIQLDLSVCESCYSKNKMNKLNLAWVYIQGVWANTQDGNINKATECYNVANKILTDLLECDCD